MVTEFLILIGRIVWLGVTLAWWALVALTCATGLFFLSDALRLMLEWITRYT